MPTSPNMYCCRPDEQSIALGLCGSSCSIESIWAMNVMCSLHSRHLGTSGYCTQSGSPPNLLLIPNLLASGTAFFPFGILSNLMRYSRRGWGPFRGEVFEIALSSQSMRNCLPDFFIPRLELAFLS